MQRSPVFIFTSAREAREFGQWLDEHFDEIRRRRRATTNVGRLATSCATRQAASAYALRLHDRRRSRPEHDRQGHAAACSWIVASHPDVEMYLLEGSFATDKKHSKLNMLRTRGKRVVAEALIPKELIARVMRPPATSCSRAPDQQPRRLHRRRQNNGAHSANAFAALFIATGQDAANVAESTAA